MSLAVSVLEDKNLGLDHECQSIGLAMVQKEKLVDKNFPFHVESQSLGLGHRLQKKILVLFCWSQNLQSSFHSKSLIDELTQLRNIFLNQVHF